MCARKMHADEVDTDASLVGRLLAAQLPQWANLPLEQGRTMRSIGSARTWSCECHASDEVRRHWSGEEHLAHVGQLPGLTRFVQNYIVASPAGHVCDGVGELWFENDDVMESALNSPEMGAAVESAKNFLDMEKTGMVVVEEKALIG